MYNVIIVDDEPLVREAITRLGKWDDFSIESIREFSNGEDALEHIKHNLVDIVITDMKMPIMDGSDLLRQIDLLDVNVKVLVVSAYSDFAYTRQAIHSKVVDYILKPVDSQNLNDALAASINELEDERNEYSQELEEISNTSIQEIATYIQHNFVKDISLNELSEAFYLSKEYISRLFKKEFKINIFEYIAKLRVNRAKELLQSTNMCIEAVAEEVGYGSGNYFSKIFRRHEEISPSEYRKKSRN